MKNFIRICKMTQPELKVYMQNYLKAHEYEVVNEDGFLYAKGTVPVLLVAHMDTVHAVQCKTILKKNGHLYSPQGIGGDDRCGIFIIMDIIKELHCSVLLCEDEEKGGIGAHKFVEATYETNDGDNIVKSKYIDHLDVNYMIEFDRKGNNDAVFYSGANQAFIDFVEDETNFKFAYGSFSDISVLMPAAKLSAVNLSSGYYNPHSTNEYVVYDEMIDTASAAKTLIKAECEKPFEYIPKTYGSYHGGSYYGGSYYGGSYRSNHSDGYGNSYYGSMYGGNYGSYKNVDEPEYSDDRLATNALHDTDLELEVIIYNLSLQEETLTATGETKAECWMNLFLENPNLRFNDIVDYSWG